MVQLHFLNKPFMSYLRDLIKIVKFKKKIFKIIERKNPQHKFPATNESRNDIIKKQEGYTVQIPENAILSKIQSLETYLKEKKHNITIKKANFEKLNQSLGYGLLLKKYMDKVTDATEKQIDRAANDLKPHVAPLFFSFRIMVACGFFFIFLFATGFYLSMKRRLADSRWYLQLAFWALPLPWVAAELGWVVAEYGRQPWAVQGILPTFMGVSSVTAPQVLTSLVGFILFYSVLAVIEVYLMVKYIRLGPDNMAHG